MPPVLPIPPDFPPVVYVPIAESVQDPAVARPVFRTTRDGRIALLVYSAPDRLRACCGDDQPWLVAPLQMVEQLRLTQPFELLMLDIMVPPEHRSTP